jgi:Leucine-rich repeat (LRR) protein
MTYKEILLQLPNLEELNIDNNKLTTFPIGDHSNTMNKLVILDVSKNQITTFPYNASPDHSIEEEKIPEGKDDEIKSTR